jgi:hypothetical protein
VPSDRAAASVLEVDDDVDGRSGAVGDWGIETELTLCDEPCLEGICLRNCSAFARAFSCVRTKPASCWEGNQPRASNKPYTTVEEVDRGKHTFTNNSPSSESMIIVVDA